MGGCDIWGVGDMRVDVTYGVGVTCGVCVTNGCVSHVGGIHWEERKCEALTLNRGEQYSASVCGKLG